MIAWVVIISLVKDLWQIKKGFVRVEESKQRLAEVEGENRELKNKLEMVTTEEYQEYLIREQLNMHKTGEVIAVLPKGKMAGDTVATESGEPKTKNWEKWWSLLK
ncbi:MAG TPA: hypothetical protein PLI45_04055 [Candidatus Woesebacteria bacterium]|nr:hypothetical protein [Candidatus Woesebacteria bacterium]